MLKLKSLAIILIYQQILIPCWTKVDITPLIILIYQIKTTKTLFFERLKNKLLNLHAIKLNCMQSNDSKISAEGLTYDDVLLIPSYSEVLPRDVCIKTRFTRNIELNVPIVSAAMDTVTESAMAIAIAREGGIGVLHKNMSIDQQAIEVRKVKRAESGMIIDPVTLGLDSNVLDAKKNMKEHRIGGIPIIDKNGILKGIVTNRDLRFEKNNERPITEVMTSTNLVTTTVGLSLIHI